MGGLDRFAQGKKDPQEAAVIGYCEMCNKEVYQGEAYYTLPDDPNSMLCSEDCVLDYIGVQKHND